MKYGLIGEQLTHSWSKIIHEQLADYNYDLIPLTQDEFYTFMKEKDFTAINVTIPYKQEVIPYLDAMDESARNIGAVNTIVNDHGILRGYNTDYLGFLRTIKRNNIDIKSKKCIVLGNGGASKAIIGALNTCEAKEIIIVNRSTPSGVLSYEQCYETHTDAELIVNTTPVGMFPNYSSSPIDLTRFPNCSVVIDIIYNPLKTKLLLQAESLHMTAINGLEMLVAQAKYACEYFTGKHLEETSIDTIVDVLTDAMK